MSSIVKHLDAQTNVRWNCRVTEIQTTTEGWRVEAAVTKSRFETYDAVVVATSAVYLDLLRWTPSLMRLIRSTETCVRSLTKCIERLVEGEGMSAASPLLHT